MWDGAAKELVLPWVSLAPANCTAGPDTLLSANSDYHVSTVTNKETLCARVLGRYSRDLATRDLQAYY